MFIIDDIVLRLLGISILPFDTIALFKLIRDFAYKEAYDPPKIKDMIKENRLLFEIGERTEEDYKIIDADLREKLELGVKAREMKLDQRMDILGGVA
ncbi:MAG: hypothetical protein HY051_00290 [Candidatus Aenigmarchaeota archaeon]|nr:hypothetical protein [Candidatus Aenigmarchaeota archaeon]